MDAKDLRAEAALTERSNDGVAKFALQFDRIKAHDQGTSAFKGDTPGVRPCAVIGPDRVVPPARDGPKKTPAEPWLVPDPMYRRLPDYSYKMPDHKDPTRNISPRQTFQENMQRIIMPPGYNATKLHEDPMFSSKNTKLNVPTEVKYCEVPYNINQVSSDQKHIRNVDHSASNVNPLLMRGVPPGWPAGSVHVRPLRTFGAPDMLPYPDYTNCTGPRPVLTRTHASTHEEPLYPDPYYHESNIRYKPYPNIKERYPQSRYEYLGNYPSPYHPSNPYAHKYELPKTMPPHSYPGYPQVPKYTERLPEPVMDGYQRALTQQGNYGVPIRNPVIHAPYRPMPGNHMQNKLNPYSPDGQHKPVANKLPYDQASKMYLDYDTRSKPLPMSDNYYLNDLPRPYHPKNTIVVPNFASSSMHGVNAHPYYIKENMSLKNYEYSRYKNMDPSMFNHSLTKLPPQFSPSTLAISPADSNASNETAQTHGTSQEDCGYVSQSSVTSVRSIDSLNRIPMDPYGRYDYRYGPMVRTSPSIKPDISSNPGSKSKKDIRQFISSWSEGDDENAENGAKREGIKNIPDDKRTFSKQYDAGINQGQLYVLGLVNVPSEELSKYEHIQKVSKLPENIKGYNSLELLNQFEEAIESSNITSTKPPTPRTVQMPLKSMPHKHELIPRALSPLDVESKISQSVIHKEVGCNFEIKPCSPKMLNVELATPMQMLNERVIEKVANPHNIKSPIILQGVDENLDHTINKTMKCPIPNTASSCKMINSQHLSNSPTNEHLKTSYTLQDLESNSGVCLASLPRLDTDIELNFPEVNQQFINANKTDSVITTSFTKDLPTLDVDRSAITSTDCDMNYQYSPKMENETDFSRLSKYRKLKRCVPGENDRALAKAQATRVDSVIIKNPDNTKSLEDNTDNPENHFRDDLQEFAMNLVSQSKHGKHQHEVDKMLDTVANSAVTGRYDDSKTYTPSSSLHQSNNLLNRQFNVIENTSRNDVHAQTQDLTIRSQDLSNRYLEKAAINIPMNLSPQARCSTTEVDEEIGHNKPGEKTAVIEDKHQFIVDNPDLNEDIQNEEKRISVINLDETDPMISLKNVSDNQCLNTRDTHLTKPNVPVNCCTTVSSIEREIKKVATGSLDSHIGNQTSHIKTVNCNKEEKDDSKNKIMGDMNVTALASKPTSKAGRVKDIVDDKKEQDRNESTPVCTDKVHSKDTIDFLKENSIFSEQYHKNLDNVPYVPKLKRKKFRGEATRRKKNYENKPVNILDNNIENSKENPSTILPKVDKEDTMGQGTSKQAQILPQDIAQETNTTNFISKDHSDIGKSKTTPFNLGTQKTNIRLQTGLTENKHRHADYDIPENILQNNIETNISVPCSPIKDKCFEKIFDIEMKAALPDDLVLDIESDVKKCNENDDSAAQPNINSGDLGVSSRILNKNATEMSIDLIDSNEHSLAQVNASINYEAKESNTLRKYQQDTTQSNNIHNNLEKNDVNMLVPSPMQQTEINHYETKNYPASDSDERELGTPVITSVKCQSVELPVTHNTDISTYIKNANIDASIQNDQNHLQSCEDLDMISTKNEGRYHDVQIGDDKNNLSNVSYESENKIHLCEDEKTTKNVPACHAFVNKERFSSRFQNLLFYNEIFGPCSAEYSSLDSMTVRSKVCLTSDGLNSDENIGDLDSSPLIKAIDKTSTAEECDKGNICEDMSAAISPENNSTHNDFGQCTKNENDKKIQYLSPETDIISSDETGMITGADTILNPVGDSVCMPFSQEINNEFGINNDKCESDLQFNNKYAVTNSVDNSGYKSSSQKIYDNCVKNSENMTGECESYLQFTTKDAVKKLVNDSSYESSCPEIEDEMVKNSENNRNECELNFLFPNKDAVLKSVGNSSSESSSSELDDECAKFSENNDSEYELDFQSIKKDMFSKSVDNSGNKSSAQKIDGNCVNNSENKSGECESYLQFTTKDAFQNLVNDSSYESSSPEIEDEMVKNSENNSTECELNFLFPNKDAVLKSVGNSSYESPSSELDDECAKISENNDSEYELDLQFTKKYIFSKSVDNSGYKSPSNEIDDECVKNLENNNGECQSDLQFTNNVDGNVCATNIIVIDEPVSENPEDSDEYSKIAAPVVSDFDSKIQSFVENLSARPRFSLKRSLSDSALNAYDDEVDGCLEKRCMLPNKRKKLCDISKIDESHLLNIIQNSRRNSVSTLSNENFSFCILIDDHCIVTEENYDQDNFMQLEDNLLTHPFKDPVVEAEKNATPVYNLAEQNENTSDSYITKYDEEKVWVEDVGCEETIETEDIAENIVIGDPVSPKDMDLTDYESDDEDIDTLNNEDAEHTSKVKHIYGDNMCTNDAQLVDALYRTPQMDVNKKLMDKESQIAVKDNKYYDSDSLEMLLAEPVDNIYRTVTETNIKCINIPASQGPVIDSMNKENGNSNNLEIPSPFLSNENLLTNDAITNQENVKSIYSLSEPIPDVNCDKPRDGRIQSYESSLDNIFSHVDKRASLHKSSSSPEVSSTTTEEKNSGILLKISNFKGSRISEVKSLACDNQKQNSCNHTTNKYFQSDYSQGSPSKRPLLTKAAQKYIPPLRESFPNLRVKLALPQQSLLKLQKNKVAKDEPKLSTCKMYINNNIKLKKEVPKKIKPKFEDVLKNIDEAQFQMHKAKNKKSKKYIPKVVIKKSENGKHYASTCAKDSFDPDLTGRKWQPWVFIEKNKFIDNMALRNKTRAVFSHRRKTFVLAEKFCKYKSISTAKFVISQPTLNDFSTGNLKYTIKLKQR